MVEALGQVPKPLLEAIELMVSELASNCVQHTAAEFEVCIVIAEGMVRIEVTDTGLGFPVLRRPRLWTSGVVAW